MPRLYCIVLAFIFQVVWQELKEGAQLFYNYVRKVQFSAQNIENLLNLYNQEVANNGNLIPTTRQSSEYQVSTFQLFNHH